MATLYEACNTGDDGERAQGTHWRGQTFTPSIAHTITSVKLKIFRTGQPGTLTASIKAVDGEGKPTGGDLCSGTTDANTLTTSSPGEWREITLGAGTDLAAGTQYAIVTRLSAGGGGNYIWQRRGGTYAGGTSWNSDDNGTVWSDLSEDSAFEEWGDELLPPTVTQQAVTDIVGSTAKGHGRVTDLGDSDVTQHGHVWAVSPAVPTVDSYAGKTELGARSSVGEFISNLTGLTPGETYTMYAYATNGAGTDYSDTLKVFVADVAGASSFPSDAVARVSSIRHIYRPGSFKMQVTLGDLGFDVDVAEATIRKELDTAKEVEETPPEPPTRPPERREEQRVLAPRPAAVSAPAVAPTPTPTTAPAAVPQIAELTEYSKAILRSEAGKAAVARQRGLQLGVKGIVTPYAIQVLKDKAVEAQLLTDIQKMTKAAGATGITGYARGVLIRKAIQLKQQLRSLQR